MYQVRPVGQLRPCTYKTSCGRAQVMYCPSGLRVHEFPLASRRGQACDPSPPAKSRPSMDIQTFQETYNEREARDLCKVLVDAVSHLHENSIVSLMSWHSSTRPPLLSGGLRNDADESGPRDLSFLWRCPTAVRKDEIGMMDHGLPRRDGAAVAA